MSSGLRVMIADNTVEFGRMLSQYLGGRGIESFCRRNDPQTIYDEIASERPDIVIISTSKDDGKAENLIEKIKNDFPDIRIFVLMYITSSVFVDKLILCGAERCIFMPDSMNAIYEALQLPHTLTGRFEFEPKISEYLVGFGIPTHIAGFRYLCSGMGIVLVNPGYVSDITGSLYRKIAAIYKVTPQNVERSLRHIALIISDRGIERHFLGRSFYARMPRGRRLTNYELICVAADAFARDFGIFSYLGQKEL